MSFEEIPAQSQEIDREKLEKLQTLEFEVSADFGPLLAHVNQELGLNLEPRPEDAHITIINPTESKIISQLSDAQIEELQQINAEIQRGEGIEINGIGLIDGSTAENIRAADKEKKTAFVALSVPKLDGFRESLGLPKRDLHLTLGFVGGDIHMEIKGQNEKGKDILGPIEKKADPEMERFSAYIPNLQFSGLSGQERQAPKKP